MKDIPIAPRCPIRTTLELLGGKWRLLTLDRLGDDALSFSELKSRLGPISDKVLAQTLHHLRENRLIELKKDRYQRTDAGAATGPLLTAIVHYGTEYERLAMQGNGK